MSKELDSLVRGLAGQYLEKLTEQQRAELISCLEIVANDEKYNRFSNFFPDEGEYKRALYPKHIDFFNAGETYTERAFISGNRVGKSEAGCYETVCHLTGNYPDWWQGKRYDRPILAWVGGDTATTCRDIVQKKFIGEINDIGSGMLPKDSIVEYKTRRNVPDAIETIRVRHVSGGVSTIVIKTYEQGRATWQGSEVDWIWMDEECPEDVYGEALIRLMTTNGSIILTFTPLSGVTPLVLTFLENSQDTDTKYPKYVQVVAWSDVPHITEEMKDKMLAATPPQLRDARSKGIPTVGSGMVYPVDPINITVDDFPIPVHYKKLYALDVGWANTAALWGAWDTDNDIIYIYSEHLQGQAEPTIHAKAIKSRGQLNGVIDPAARGRSQVDGRKLFEMYLEEGLKLYLANNAVEAGIFTVWERMTTGRLKIFKSCTQLLRELSLYHRDEKGKIVKTNDHLIDCLAGDVNVLTEQGYIPISDAVDMDIHLVTYAGNFVKPSRERIFKKDRELVELSFNDGVSIKTTPDHLLLGLDGLWYPSIIAKNINIAKLGDQICQTISNKSSLEKHIGCAESIFKDMGEDFISQYGNTVSESGQKAIMSTILMEIDRTTALKTWNALQPQNTYQGTVKSVLEKGLSLLSHNKHLLLLLNGTEEKTGKSGTKNIMKNMVTSCMSLWSENVPFAANYTKLLGSLEKIASAITIASQSLEEDQALTMYKGFVKFVEVNLLPINIVRRSFVQELAAESIVEKTTVKSVMPCKNEDVYCFTVDNYDSFVIDGGIISHNCTRYMLNSEAHLWAYPKDPRQKQKVVDISQYMSACT